MEALVDVEDNLSVDPCLAWKQLCSKAGRREVEVLNGSHNTVVVGTDQEYLASYFNCKFKALHSYIIMRNITTSIRDPLLLQASQLRAFLKVERKTIQSLPSVYRRRPTEHKAAKQDLEVPPSSDSHPAYLHLRIGCSSHEAHCCCSSDGPSPFQTSS